MRGVTCLVDVTFLRGVMCGECDICDGCDMVMMFV